MSVFPLLVWRGFTMFSNQLSDSVTKTLVRRIKEFFNYLTDSAPPFLKECCDSDSKESSCNAGDPGSISGSVPWRRVWQPTPVFLPGGFHGQRSVVGYSPWGCEVEHDWVTSTFRVWSTPHLLLAWCTCHFPTLLLTLLVFICLALHLPHPSPKA